MKFLRRNRSNPTKFKFRFLKKSNEPYRSSSEAADAYTPGFDERRDESDVAVRDTEVNERPWVHAAPSSLSDSLELESSRKRHSTGGSVLSYASDGSTTKGELNMPKNMDWEELHEAANVMRQSLSCRNEKERTILIESDAYQNALMKLIKASNSLNMTVKELYAALNKMKETGMNWKSVIGQSTRHGEKYERSRAQTILGEASTRGEASTVGEASTKIDENTWTSGREDFTVLFPEEVEVIGYMEEWFSCLLDALESTSLIRNIRKM